MLLTKKLIAVIFLITLGLFVFLQKVFSGQILLPQSFSLGIFSIHYYGIIMAFAVGVGYLVAMKRAKDFNITERQADNLIFWVSISGFIGARLYHVFSSLNLYLNNPVDIFKVWNGGLSIYGAVLGGIFSIIVLKKLVTSNSSLVTILNWLTPSLILGQIIGRFGNLFNYEAYGSPTDLPWKMFVPIEFRPEQFVLNMYFHPFFLYEALGNFIILVILFKIETKFNLKKRLFFYYVLLYNILRFCLEFLRIDSTFIGIFRLNAVVSFVLILISFYYLKKKFEDAKVS